MDFEDRAHGLGARRLFQNSAIRENSRILPTHHVREGQDACVSESGIHGPINSKPHDRRCGFALLQRNCAAYIDGISTNIKNRIGVIVGGIQGAEARGAKGGIERSYRS